MQFFRPKIWGGAKLFFFWQNKIFFGTFFFWAPEVKPEVNRQEVDPEGRGVGGTPLVVMQEDCLVVVACDILQISLIFRFYKNTNKGVNVDFECLSHDRLHCK